ncbi:uncharacterized protein METZ01_LOCUS371980 [marine metagenome]|uniref:Uncharacterized protein n=1 Tax=marine metagenome TaxID=408172 RepID=A0A382TAP6_9ZZZZ
MLSSTRPGRPPVGPRLATGRSFLEPFLVTPGYGIN